MVGNKVHCLNYPWLHRV